MYSRYTLQKNRSKFELLILHSNNYRGGSEIEEWKSDLYVKFD